MDVRLHRRTVNDCINEEGGGAGTGGNASNGGGGGMVMQVTACPKFPDHAAYLLEQLNMQRIYGAFCDVTVRVENCDFRLHKCLLAATSSKLQTLMYAMTAQTDCLPLKDVPLNGFRIIIDCIYSGVLRLDTDYAQDVLAAAHFLELPDIYRACFDFLKQVHADVQPRVSSGFDSNNMGIFRSNSNQMLNMQTYTGMPLDPHMHLSDSHEFTNDGQQVIPSDQQSLPPDADDLCHEQMGNGSMHSHGMSQTRLQNDNVNNQGLVPQTNEKVLSHSMSSPKVMATNSNNGLNSNAAIMDEHTRLINEHTFNLNPDFSSPQPHSQVMQNSTLHSSAIQGYSSHEQMIPLNLHRASNSQLVLNSDKDLDLNQDNVLSNQTLGPDSHLLASSQGFHGDNSLILPSDQYSNTANLLANEGLSQGHQGIPSNHNGNPQILPGGSGSMDLKSSNIMGLSSQGLQNPQQIQPLTPVSQQTEQPDTPNPRQGMLTPTPPLQHHVFPVAMVQNTNLGNTIEDYLKMIEASQGEQTTATSGGHLTNDLQIDPITSLNSNGNNGYGYKQEYGKVCNNAMSIMDMDGLLPPVTSTGISQQMLPQHYQSLSRHQQEANIVDTQPTYTTSNMHMNLSSTLSTAEDVRKTILNVLSQERFDDDDEDSLTKSLETSEKLKENVPLTSLLNIATVSHKNCQDITIDSTAGFSMAKDNTNANDSLNIDTNFTDQDAGIGSDSDSDHEGNLVIVEPELEEQDVYDACDIANSSNSDVQMALDSTDQQTMKDSYSVSKMSYADGSDQKLNESRLHERQKLNSLTEYEDEYRVGGDVQMDNNFAKPLKKRLRLKLVNDDNEESEVNTPVENETVGISDLSVITESEPVSRKKHLLDSSKSMIDNSSSITTPTEQPTTITFDQSFVFGSNISPDLTSQLPSIEEEQNMFNVQSKKQMACKQEKKDKEANSAEVAITSVPPKKQKMKPPYHDVKVRKDSNGSSVSDVFQEDVSNLSSENTSESDRNKQESNVLIVTNSCEENMKKDSIKKKYDRQKPSKDLSRKGSQNKMDQGTKKINKSVSKETKKETNKPAKKHKTHMKQSTLDNVQERPEIPPLPAISRPKLVEHHCDLCGRNFPKLERLAYHLKQHKLNKLHQCNICEQSFGRAGELTRHLRQHTQTVFKCRNCTAEFHNSNLYRAHCLKIHQERKMFYCSNQECDFVSEKLCLIIQHELIHSTERGYSCENCGQKFRQPNGLRSHQQSCKKRQLYSCKFCDKKFNYTHGLKQHELIHTGDKPLECPTCGIRTRDRRNLKRHMRIHEQSYPYECEFCPKKYRFSNSLKHHLKSHALDSDSKSNAKKSSRKGKNSKNSNGAQVVIASEGCEENLPDLQELVNEKSSPRLWDVTDVTFKNEASNETLKVKLEASLVTDSGYV